MNRREDTEIVKKQETERSEGAEDQIEDRDSGSKKPDRRICVSGNGDDTMLINIK